MNEIIRTLNALRNAHDVIERLQAERDEARRWARRMMVERDHWLSALLSNMLRLQEVIGENDNLRSEIKRLRLDLYAVRMTSTETINDGSGNTYPKYCVYCGAENHIIRPGCCACADECNLAQRRELEAQS